MITKSDLRLLSKKRLIDARVLLQNKRFFGSIYLAGYAVELALKYRIASLMRFNAGFPENKFEFNTYYTDTSKTLLRSTIKELRDIRNHDLNILLHYSGEQITVQRDFAFEWSIVESWNPEMQYINRVVRKSQAVEFFKGVSKIVNELI